MTGVARTCVGFEELQFRYLESIVALSVKPSPGRRMIPRLCGSAFASAADFVSCRVDQNKGTLSDSDCVSSALN